VILIAGIDPGKDGGYVTLTSDGRICQMIELASALECLCHPPIGWVMPKHIFIERAQVMAKKRDDGTFQRPSAVAMFSYGTGFGEILGIVRALHIPHTLVRPADWTLKMHEGTKATTTDKKRSFEAGRRLFPGSNWMVDGRRKPHDGLCEAALIAEYGRRCLGAAGNLKQPYDATFSLDNLTLPSWDDL